MKLSKLYKVGRDKCQTFSDEIEHTVHSRNSFQWVQNFNCLHPFPENPPIKRVWRLQGGLANGKSHVLQCQQK